MTEGRSTGRPGADDADERTLAELRPLLHEPAQLPPGMLSRLEAHVLRSARQREERSWLPRLVVGSLVFSVAGTVEPAVVSPLFALAAACSALAYAATMKLDQPSDPQRAGVRRTR
jgi:hypothetical protein